MKPESIIKLAGTYVVVGAASAAGAALWTYVLQGKCGEFARQIKHKKSDKIIDFKKAKKRLSR